MAPLSGPKSKVFVAMSGGVDSSVAAALLKKQGYDITGVFFKPWLSPDGKAFCNWRQDKQDATRVAAKLGIKFKVWDFSEEYGKKVVEYMVNSYQRGITPNPDVACNKEIKFGLFLKKTLAEGADIIATGHYARLRREFPISNPAPERSSVLDRSRIETEFLVRGFQFPNKSKIQVPNYKLLKGKDKNKDQSYFLWTLTQKQLRYCLFPIGDYTKPEVRKLAKKFGLPNYAKRDSQGVCFIGQLDMKEFLKGYIKPRKGEIKLLETGLPPHSKIERGGKTVGHHDGVFYYTIGQRHGLDIKIGGGPYFVASKDIKENIIYVTTNEKNLATDFAEIEKINWINQQPALPARAGVKIRYRSKSVPAEISKSTKVGALVIKFKNPARAVTSGQSAVLYRGEEVLGGGIII